MASADSDKKQVPLRLNRRLWEDLSAWAADDFRSLNGQIEYLLSECVKRRARTAHDARTARDTRNVKNDSESEKVLDNEA